MYPPVFIIKQILPKIELFVEKALLFADSYVTIVTYLFEIGEWIYEVFVL